MLKKNKTRNKKLYIERLYHKYENMIFKISLDILKDKYLAEDASQETAYKIMKYCDRVKYFEGEQERNYIAAIARNTAINVYNKHNKIAEESCEENDEIPDDSPESDPEEYVITNESVDKIINELKNLGTKYSGPLILSRIYKYSIKEISDILGVPERTIKYRMKCGTEKLKEKLKKGDESE